MTILDYFLKWEKETSEETFLRQPAGTEWTNYSWKRVGEESRKILAGLQHKGYKKGDRIAILSANCAQWIICDIALMMGGYVSVPLYANVNAKSLQSILLDSGSRFMFIGKLHPKDWEKIKGAIPKSVQTATMEGYNKDQITIWQDFIRPSTEAILVKPLAKEVATIIYTSGTTGESKGVVHTYGSIMNAVLIASEPVLLNRKGNRFISYLPLSHAAERGLIECGGIFCGGTIAFVETRKSFTANVQAIAPTHFFGVPRIWEKFQSKILEKILQKRLSFFLKIPILAGLVKSRIRKALGLNKAEIIFSGAAPIASEIILWFQKLGIVICEAYGLTEDFNVLSMNPREDIRAGTVGKLFDKQKVYIDSETKEIRQKCDWLMQGYYNKPELTTKTIVNGYLHTGDMGNLSEDGYLTIIGRVKDIFKTTKGEYISPAVLEMPFLEMSITDQACVMGSHYPQPFILIGLSDIGKGMDQNETRRQLEEMLNKVNLESMEYQNLKKAIIVKEEWTNENELLTPTLKMKRNLLSQKYEPELKAVYEKDEMVSWE